jgi:hypothetical protein
VITSPLPQYRDACDAWECRVGQCGPKPRALPSFTQHTSLYSTEAALESKYIRGMTHHDGEYAGGPLEVVALLGHVLIQ